MENGDVLDANGNTNHPMTCASGATGQKKWSCAIQQKHIGMQAVKRSCTTVDHAAKPETSGTVKVIVKELGDAAAVIWSSRHIAMAVPRTMPMP